MQNLAVYIHWPYCARICPYCDFNVYKQKTDTNLTNAILRDLFGWRKWSGPRKITSIHFGGGTPSLIESDDIHRMIDQIRDLWGLAHNCEIAIEANPHDADVAKWNAYHETGINRLSLGAQSFHDPALKLLGRDHDAASAKAALALAKNIFPSVSIDLIFGWAGQTSELLRRDLDFALSYAPDHMSAYQLTIEAGTAFAKAEARGDKKIVGEDPSAVFYDLIRDQLVRRGYAHYEVSNFAKPGHKSRHNLAYWKGEDYVGVGPGAHGRLTEGDKRYATIAAMRPDEYSSQVTAKGLGLAEKETLSAQGWGEEYVLMGLRIDSGISLQRYAEITGGELPALSITELVDLGLLMKNGDTIKATPQGRLLLNRVTTKLLTWGSN